MSKSISIGSSIVNQGSINSQDEKPYVLDKSRKYLIIDVVPMGAVRMTQSDRWKTDPNHKDPNRRQRDAVRRYFEFKNKVVQECNKHNFQLEGCIEAVFCIPMPESWSDKKKKKMAGLPCKKRPDIDNLTKALMDAVRKEDGDIWKITAEKRYSYLGSIILYA